MPETTFLTKEELKSVIYVYQIDQITEEDDDIVYMAISSAVDLVKSFLRPNNKREWLDGRIRYDVDTVFAATGTERNDLLLDLCKNVAVWNLTKLCNLDIIYDQAKDRFDRAIDFLKKVNKGDITLDLPEVTPPPPPENGSDEYTPFRFGSRKKFNHE